MAHSSFLADYFGRGIVAPFRRASNDLAIGEGPDNIKDRLANILGVNAGDATSPGELPWRTSFGTMIRRLRHAPNNPTVQAMAKHFITSAIGRWEPQVRVTGVTFRSERIAENGIDRPALRIRMTYEIVSRGTRDKVVEGKRIEVLV